MIGSLDCMHWEWKNCPSAYKGQYQGRSGRASIILEAVASQDLWIWHAFFGVPGSGNDLNVLYQSPLFYELQAGTTPIVTYEVNGHQYSMGYYLTDGIYPPWATFVKTIPVPGTDKRKLFAERQEAARKDVERAFGVLQGRWHIIRNPGQSWSKKILSDIMMTCIILHNMIVEDERETYANYADISEFNEDEASSSSASVNEPFQYSSGQPLNLQRYMLMRNKVREKITHKQLQQDLIENIWQRFGH